MFKCASFNEITEEIIVYLVCPSSRHQKIVCHTFELVEPQDQALMTSIKTCMKTFGAMGDLEIKPLFPSSKPPEKKIGEDRK